MPLVEIVSAGAAAAQALLPVIQALNGVRSVLLEVDNITDITLTHVSDSHDHGGFAVLPISQIPPGKADVFGSQNKGGSIATGTQGKVVYRGDDGLEFNVYWDNPFAGDNSCSASVSMRKYRVNTACGVGNAGAHMRYELFKADMHGFDVFGAILDKWADLNYSDGPLRFPASDELFAFDGVGKYRNFEGGIVSWRSETGAHIVWGLIGERWLQIGREQFGYPITDESATPDGRGRYNHFRALQLPSQPEASIYWHPDTGAHEVYGGIRAKWAEMGWEQSALGYPVSVEQDQDGGRVQQFQGGALFWTPQGGTVVK